MKFYTEAKDDDALPIPIKGIETCKQTLSTLIRYSLHPDVDTFTKEERSKLLDAYHILTELGTQLRPKYGLSESV